MAVTTIGGLASGTPAQKISSMLFEVELASGGFRKAPLSLLLDFLGIPSSTGTSHTSVSGENILNYISNALKVGESSPNGTGSLVMKVGIAANARQRTQDSATVAT